ncbi:DNA polymerase sliding clamp [Methanosarcinales archaeon]|nr:MAG: DNA polymerase sliding clamp [Methanosarcinales archaeon]RLG26934.1 MAG: DNA polymerase sliding clamp [Methanosarcinales archaeon]HHI30190.1 DNA polymerase sliding clamp [Candidatus Methanoperedenaceae archaeon]
MFSAEIDSDKLKEAFETVAVLVDECKLRFSPTELSIRAVDPANVAMVTLDLFQDAFNKYEASEGEIGLDLGRFMDILGMAGREDTVILQLDETAHKLLIYIGGLAYTTSLLDPTTIRREPKIPEFELPAHITLPGSVFVRAIKAAAKVDEYMWMQVADDNFILEAEGDMDNVRIKVGEDDLIGLESSDAARSLFKLEYLQDMGKAIGKASEIRIDIGKDYPVKINFKITGGSGDVTYILAPRVVESE